jgi:hypothetical protein
LIASTHRGQDDGRVLRSQSAITHQIKNFSPLPSAKTRDCELYFSILDAGETRSLLQNKQNAKNIFNGAYSLFLSLVEKRPVGFRRPVWTARE